ncbi:MAG: PspC domain-containing protein [Microbacterium sp.]
MNGLVRPRSNRIIAGVCSALANRFGLPTWAVRLGAVAAVLFAGLSIWVYVILWIVIPSE